MNKNKKQVKDKSVEEVWGKPIPTTPENLVRLIMQTPPDREK